MKVIELKEINKKDSPLHYRNEFSGSALFEIKGQEQTEIPVAFTIEHTATGMIHISVKVMSRINYPLVPVINALKKHIGIMHDARKLI